MSETLKKQVIISEIHSTQQIGSNGFTKRLLIGKTVEQYEQEIPFEFQYDQTELLNNYRPGEEVIVYFNIRCKGYSKFPDEPKKYFPTLVAYKIERIK